MSRFIDLYAGIGGFRFAFEAHDNECVFSSEWDKYSQITYNAFHGETPFGDIHLINDIDLEIPDHNILTAGFPCQPFSLAGVSKKNSLGRLHGFEDPTQGTEFFKIKEILRIKQPEAFLLENVKNLKSHDDGKTFSIICDFLHNIGYTFKTRIIDASKWIPQHRERIFFIGFRNDLDITENDIERLFPIPPNERLYGLEEILLSQQEITDKFADKYTVGPGTWSTLERHKQTHAEKGNGFGYSIISQPYEGKVTRTISARYSKDGAEILIEQRDKRPRRLTPFEACKLQGFPERCYNFYNGTLPQPVSDTQAYKQFGNSVAVPVITAIAENISNLVNDILLEQNFLGINQNAV